MGLVVVLLWPKCKYVAIELETSMRTLGEVAVGVRGNKERIINTLNLCKGKYFWLF